MNKKPNKTKKQRKLLKAGNAMVQFSIHNGRKIGEYIGKSPRFVDHVKVQAGLPFVRKSLHNL